MTDPDQFLKRLQLWVGASTALLMAGFAAAVFLFSHYASASDLDRLSDHVSDTLTKESEHDALIRDLREDIKWIRATLDELRSR